MKDRLTRVNSTSPEKPHLHTLSTGLSFHKNMQGFALRIAHSCVRACVLSPRGQTGSGEQRDGQQTPRSIPPLAAKALPCGAGKPPKRCERGGKKKKSSSATPEALGQQDPKPRVLKPSGNLARDRDALPGSQVPGLLRKIRPLFLEVYSVFQLPALFSRVRRKSLRSF